MASKSPTDYHDQKVNDNSEKEEEDNNDGNDCDEEDEDEEEEEEEPKLKYKRIGNALLDILHEDAASCMAVHPKFLALGTHWGVVHILDHQGNNIRSKEFPSHSTTVNQLSIDNSGDYIASCSEDGRVVINGLYTAENNIQHTFDSPIRSVGLHPEFGKKNNRQYVIGVGEKLMLFEKGWLRNKSTVIHSGEGFVRSIKWKRNFIAWANSQGVEVYDTNTKERITHIKRDDRSPRDDLFPCNICWKNDRIILIAWAAAIKVCVIKQRLANDIRDLPTHYVEIVHMFRTDFYASGIAPFGDELAVLAYFVNRDEGVAPQKGRAQRPQLLVIQPQGIDNYVETSTDALSVRGFEEYLCNNYCLEHIQEEQMFYIVSPKDIVIAKPRDMDDHITWLLEREYFKEALDKAELNPKDLKQHSVLNIGRSYLNFLIRQKQYQNAAIMCDRILGTDKDLWEEEVYRFAKLHKLKIITPYIPYRNPQLNSTIYEMILNEFLQTDYEVFYKIVRDWPIDLYKTETIIYSIQAKLREEPKQSILLQALATLFAYEKKYGEALQIYLELQHNDVFDMIFKHKLLGYIQEKYLQLMQIDKDKATAMFVENLEDIPVNRVVKQLKKNKKLLHQYLNGLFIHDPLAGQEFHNMQVELYAEFQPDRLLPFLRNSNYYQLENALKVCEERDYIQEMVFLLGRMGNNKKALALIIDKMKNIKKAIEFAKEENDEDLWNDLITQSLDKPEFIKELLFNIGTHVDPQKLIKRIPPGLEIPFLRDALVKILQDYNLQVSLHEGCKTILDKDSVGLIQKQLKSQTHGYKVQDFDKCHGCQGKLIVDDSRHAINLVCFNCQHYFHDVCLQQDRQMDPFCPICASKKSSSRKKIVS